MEVRDGEEFQEFDRGKAGRIACARLTPGDNSRRPRMERGRRREASGDPDPHRRRRAAVRRDRLRSPLPAGAPG